MFTKSTAKLSLLLLAFALLPSGIARADDPLDIVTGSDPQPTGEPHPHAIIGSPLWLEMELAIMMAL